MENVAKKMVTCHPGNEAASKNLISMNKFSEHSLMGQSYSPKSLTEHLQTIIPLDFKNQTILANGFS